MWRRLSYMLNKSYRSMSNAWLRSWKVTQRLPLSALTVWDHKAKEIKVLKQTKLCETQLLESLCWWKTKIPAQSVDVTHRPLLSMSNHSHIYLLMKRRAPLCPRDFIGNLIHLKKLEELLINQLLSMPPENQAIAYLNLHGIRGYTLVVKTLRIIHLHLR
jgi:hypothetical protein